MSIAAHTYVTFYEYDVANRPARTTQLDSSNWNLHTAVLSYDAYNNISRFEEQLGYWRTKYPTDFIYDDENRPTSLRYNGTVNRTDYVYDSLGRIASRNAVLNNASYLSSYGYAAGGYGANSTSPLVSSIMQSGHNLSYVYDDNGNITSAVYKGQTIGYVYDALGQLIRVNDQANNESWTYEYDRGGNILGKKRYSYTIGTLGSPNHTEEYQYGDTNWKDKLTARVINGVSYPVVSDAIGNMTSYAGWTYAWQAGRQLASQTNSGGTVEYKYNADGLRVQKKRGSTVTDYVLSGNNIVHMTVTGGHTLHFYYDGQNRPAQVQYNGTMYRYVHSLQGDILAILDSAGNTVVQYAYDAWGGKKTTTGSMAGTLGYYNPFRYRGYVWDEETSMYYLRSRYYYPELQRFISPDIYIMGNLFCYCLNSPVDTTDLTGLFPFNVLEVPMVPVERLPYTAQKLAGEEPDEIKTTTKRYSIKGKGTGKLYLPNKDVINFTYNGIRNYYHVDIWTDDAGFKTLSGIDAPYTYGKYTPAVPIILELDYKEIKIRTWAVLHPNPHNANNEMCVWLINSDGDAEGGFGSRRKSYGRDNADIEKAPLAFIRLPSYAGKGNNILMPW